MDRRRWHARTRIEAFAATSFLYGANAPYIEELHARYAADPASVDAEWRDFFEGLKDAPDAVIAEAARRAVAAARLAAGGERRAGLGARRQLGGARDVARPEDQGRRRQRAAPRSADGAVTQATRDSVRALMMIRAYRMRGHFHANLDPLGLETPRNRDRARPGLLRLHRGRLRPPDLHRPRARARIRHHPRDARDPQAHLLLDARRRVHAHLRCRREELDPGAHRGPRQGHRLHPRGQEGDPQQADRGRGLREVPRRQVHRHQALRPRRRRIADPGARADHQARRRARRARDRARHGPSRPAQRARPGAWASRTAPSSTSSRAARRRPTTSRAPATSSTTSAPRPTASSTATRCTCR